jgi:hypothetical protein
MAAVSVTLMFAVSSPALTKLVEFTVIPPVSVVPLTRNCRGFLEAAGDLHIQIHCALGAADQRQRPARELVPPRPDREDQLTKIRGNGIRKWKQFFLGHLGDHRFSLLAATAFGR